MVELSILFNCLKRFFRIHVKHLIYNLKIKGDKNSKALKAPVTADDTLDF